MFEIFFDDLKPDAQRQLLEAFNVKNEKEMNWDVFPVAYVEGEKEDENN